MSVALNLARRPFRNERLPTLLLAAGCILLGALTVRHALAARDLLPGRALDVEREAVTLERELAALRVEAEKLGGAKQPVPAIQEWAAVKELVDRREFSWTGLFADLENALPPSVRLATVAPQMDKGRLVLSMSAVGREVDDALALYEALQAHPSFRGAQLLNYSESASGLEITCRVAYAPEPTTPAGAAGARGTAPARAQGSGPGATGAAP